MTVGSGNNLYYHMFGPRQGGLPHLVKLLRSHEKHVCGGAAGTIQNMSREENSRALLRTFGVVEPLADLLVGRHMKSQVKRGGDEVV